MAEVAYSGPDLLRVQYDHPVMDRSTRGIPRDRLFKMPPYAVHYYVLDHEVSEGEFSIAAMRFFRALMPAGIWGLPPESGLWSWEVDAELSPVLGDALLEAMDAPVGVNVSWWFENGGIFFEGPLELPPDVVAMLKRRFRDTPR